MEQLASLAIAFLLVSAFGNTVNAVEYDAANNAAGTAGGTRFDNEIGLDYSKQVLSDASSFIWTIFQQSEADRKDVQLITLSIDNDFQGNLAGAVAYASGNAIHFNATYIAGYNGDIKTEFTGVLYHELTHVWQWNGNGNADGGLIEGIADYVRLKAGLAPSHWIRPGQGNQWNQGYDVTAYFLDYCDSLDNGFVAQLNAKLKDGYSEDFFVELLGKTVDELWQDYKAKYGN